MTASRASVIGLVIDNGGVFLESVPLHATWPALMPAYEAYTCLECAGVPRASGLRHGFRWHALEDVTFEVHCGEGNSAHAAECTARPNPYAALLDWRCTCSETDCDGTRRHHRGPIIVLKRLAEGAYVNCVAHDLDAFHAYWAMRRQRERVRACGELLGSMLRVLAVCGLWAIVGYCAVYYNAVDFILGPAPNYTCGDLTQCGDA